MVSWLSNDDGVLVWHHDMWPILWQCKSDYHNFWLITKFWQSLQTIYITWNMITMTIQTSYQPILLKCWKLAQFEVSDWARDKYPISLLFQAWKDLNGDFNLNFLYFYDCPCNAMLTNFCIQDAFDDFHALVQIQNINANKSRWMITWSRCW